MTQAPPVSTAYSAVKVGKFRAGVLADPDNVVPGRNLREKTAEKTPVETPMTNPPAAISDT